MDALNEHDSQTNGSSNSGGVSAKLEQDLWEESYLRCCNELADWKEMCEYATDAGQRSLKQLFTDSSYTLESLFPYAFKSKLKIILQEDVSEQRKHQDLVRFVSELDADGKKYLEHAFCQEMAIINLHQKDFNAAKYYANMAIQKFLTVNRLKIHLYKSYEYIFLIRFFFKRNGHR